MKEDFPHCEISLPCLRGQVEDWIYYVTLMNYGEVALRFKAAEEIHKNATLNELIQRSLTKRADEISQYIIHQKQHFFNAIIAGIYEGEPNWIEVDFVGVDRSSVRNDTNQIQGAVGVLELSGAEKIFAIDGQHRVEGIKLAVETEHKHKSEEAVVIFVAHNNSKRGLERTRRLFSTLNRYAKPVTLGEIIALDEDDAIAITTRKLLYHHSLLKQEKVISPSKTKSIPRNNAEAFTSIQSLYELLTWFLLISKGMKPKKIREFKQLRRPIVELEEMLKESVSFIDLTITSFGELTEYAATKGPNRAESYRNKTGGSLIFRPVGISILGSSIAMALQHGQNVDDVLTALSNVNRDLNADPWSGLLYDNVNNKMRPRISATDISVASKIWLTMSGLMPKNNDSMTLTKEYAGAMGINLTEASRKLKSLNVL